MTIEQAIKKAIKAGWTLRGGLPTYEAEMLSIAHPNIRIYYEDGSIPMAFVDVGEFTSQIHECMPFKKFSAFR